MSTRGGRNARSARFRDRPGKPQRAYAKDACAQNWDDTLARHGYGLTAIRYVLSPHVALTF